MAKKFGKFMLFTAAIGTAAAAAYYYMKKKDAEMSVSDESDDDYDNFSDDFDEDEEASRNYVSLNLDSASSEDTPTDDDSFTPLSEQFATQTEEVVTESVEEFFDEDDEDDAEPPIQDN